MNCPVCGTDMIYREHMGSLGLEICPNCGATHLPEDPVSKTPFILRPTRDQVANRVFEILDSCYGADFAGRCMKHIDWIEKYDGHGGPGHMEYVIIQALLEAALK